MTATETLPPSRGRGRPRTEHPLSNAERQKRYRERQKSADKPENPQTVHRINQLQERIERLESRQQDMLVRFEKRQAELEHRLKSLQTLLTRVVQRLDTTPPSSSRAVGEKASARRKVDSNSRSVAAPDLTAHWPPVSAPSMPSSIAENIDTVSVLAESAETAAMDSPGAQPVQYHLHAGNRCQIGTGREGSQCSGKVSHTVTLKLPNGSLGEFGVCQIHFRQFQQRRLLTPSPRAMEELPPSD